jgi:myo-inositol-hexaphosphate 3-phosphohydrolase
MPACTALPRRLVLLLLGLLAVVLLCAAPARAATDVCATVESDAARQPLDADDDAAVWVNPSNPAQSTFIGADKLAGGGLSVFDLSGHELFFYPDDRVNNVDIRYNFPLGSKKVTLVGATNRDNGRVDYWTVNESNGSLTPIGSVATSSAILTPRGFAMYHSPSSGKYYAFVTDRGHTDQYELDGSSGTLKGTLVRQMLLHNPTEGLAADDNYAQVYVAEEDIGGITRYGAEPGDGTTGVRIDNTTDNPTTPGHIVQDVKGLSIYYGRNGAGYLLAASQGGDGFHVYNRSDNAWRGEFKIVDCPQYGTDKVTAIDGFDVTNVNMGSAFPYGFVVSQDDQNPGANQNYKLVPWQFVAQPMGLTIDNKFNPRSIGAGADTPLPPPTDPTPPSGGSNPGTGGPGPGTGSGSNGSGATSGGNGGGAAAAGVTPPTPAGTGAFGSHPGVRAILPAKKRVRISGGWRLRLVVSNANPFAVGAVATLSTTTGSRLAAPVRFTVRHRRTIVLRLSKGARRLMRHRSRKAQLTLTLKDPAGHTRGVWATITLLPPRR